MKVFLVEHCLLTDEKKGGRAQQKQSVKFGLSRKTSECKLFAAGDIYGLFLNISTGLGIVSGT